MTQTPKPAAPAPKDKVLTDADLGRVSGGQGDDALSGVAAVMNKMKPGTFGYRPPGRKD